MSRREKASEIRRADPELRAGRPSDPLRPFGVPKVVGVFLFALFWVLLLFPRIRRARRHPRWYLARLSLGAAGAVGLLCAVSGQVGGWWLAVPGGLALIAAALLSPTRDPDAERKLQARHRAEYLLNGGRLLSGKLPNSEPLSPNQALYLLIRESRLLIVPREGDGDIHSAVDIAAMERVLVNGAPYVPVYVSEAKDPPVKEQSVDRRGKSTLELRMKNGSALNFEYEGAFSKHLAETAAHAIYSVARINCEDPLSVLR